MKPILFFASGLLLLACSSSTEEATQQLPEPYAAGMDTTARPQDDFYQYANGGWLRSTAIPPTEHSWSVFDELRDKTERECLALLLDASQSQAYPEGSDVRKAIRFFRRAMDSLLAERRGLTPLRSTWNKIALIKTKADLQQYLLEAELTGNNPLFHIRVKPDLTDSKTYGVFIQAVEPGLPDRDYYVSFDAKAKEVRARYELHITTMLQLAGIPEVQAKKETAAILAYETYVAKIFPSPEERNDPTRWNNPRSIAELNRTVASIKWEEYFKGLNLAADTVNVAEPIYLRELERSFSSFSIETLKSFLRWAALRQAAPFLNHALVKESFEFNLKYLRGVERLSPRWQRAFRETNKHFGDAIAKLYIRKNNNIEAMEAVRLIIDNVRFGMAYRIKTRTWLSDSTKELALAKLRSMQVRIGYPEKWHSYASLTINTDTTQSSFYEDVTAAHQVQVTEAFAKAGKSLDSQEWANPPQTVDIFYHPSGNELVLPMALVQAPFFDVNQDDAVNYGAIGALIGREIIHGFDVIGTVYDRDGNLRTWLTIDERKKFAELTQQLIAQQNKKEGVQGIPVKFSRTLNEDLCDLSGLAIALEGLQRATREQPHGKTDAPGSLERRFFLSWSSIWRMKYRPQQLAIDVKVGTNTPTMIRTHLPLTNLEVFDSVFHVKEGDKLYRSSKDRLEIW